MSLPLPPPPDDPERPPAVRLEGEREVTFSAGTAGPMLAGRVREAPGATRALLVLHPHPLYGGTMDNAVVVALCRAAARRGYATLRFNFRGVAPSRGSYDAGRGEVDDAHAALRTLRAAQPGAEVYLVGYSFGSAVAAALAARESEVSRVALLAPVPALLPYPRARLDAASCVILGEHDDYTALADARSLAGDVGARFVVIPGADHFFTRGRSDLAALVLNTLEANP